MRLPAEAIRRLFAALFALATLSCAHYPENAPLAEYDPSYGYRISAKSGDSDDSMQFLLVTTFSGGGTRAAAFAYGYLEALRETVVEFDGRERSLVDEIDIISGVSGGSVAAAYFGVYGRGIFARFPDRFLYANVQGGITRRVLAPWNWVRLASPYFGRGDILAEYLDEKVFEGATFGDMVALETPFVTINATDVTLGARFGFDQEQFDMLCSDLSDFPIARAVAASSAVPVLLSPVTLRNYPAERCGYEVSARERDIIETGDVSSREYQEASRIAAYADPDGDRYVHLLDGGLADNLGLRATIEKATGAGGYVGLVRKTGFLRFRRVAHVVINAQKDADTSWSESAQAPGLLRTLVAAPGVTLNRYNFETVETFKQDRESWIEELRTYRCEEDDSGLWVEDCEDLEAYFIELNFAQHPDPEERAYLTSLPTSFALDPEAVDRVRAAGRLLLSRSAEFQRLVRDLGDLP